MLLMMSPPSSPLTLSFIVIVSLLAKHLLYPRPVSWYQKLVLHFTWFGLRSQRTNSITDSLCSDVLNVECLFTTCGYFSGYGYNSYSARCTPKIFTINCKAGILVWGVWVSCNANENLKLKDKWVQCETVFVCICDTLRKFLWLEKYKYRKQIPCKVGGANKNYLW